MIELFAGIDLAWGERAASGIAVLDDDGALVHLSRRRTDEEIVAALAPYRDQIQVAGIDAPLVVANASGTRPAEAALNRDFARFEAGTHPTNTSRSEFGARPRGARLASLLGLTVSDHRAASGAVEVYPHAASISLFRLGRTLKYKQRSGRPFELIQAEMQRLVAGLESLGSADPALELSGSSDWERVRTAVGRATRKSDLRLVEDELDAILCAYVALLAARQPQRLTTYGEADTGAIVTPTLPDDLVPQPRPRRVSAGSAVKTYTLLQPEVTQAAMALARWLTEALDEAGINYQYISSRGKSVESFAAKISRERDGQLLYPDPLHDMTDQIGTRIITYVSSDVAAVADLITDQLEVVEDKDLGRATAEQGRFGYVSRHLQVALDPSWMESALVERLPVTSAQIQIRTVLQHAWAEFEHDIRYKGTVPEELAPDLNRRFTLAAGLLELADREFEIIRDRLRRTTTEPTDSATDDPRLDTRELAAFLAGNYPDAGWSRTDHYAWVAGLLLELGITSLQELAEVLSEVDSAAITARMGYRYPPGAVRRLDDALLAAFGDRYLNLHGNAHRVEQLRARQAKLRLAGPGQPS